MVWPDGLSKEESDTLIEQVKAGLLTETEARARMKMPPTEWGDDRSPDEVTSLPDQIKGGALTENEAREMS